MDNCSENKNKILFSFLSDLVSRKVFSEINVGFLMVGHTHEDIDQLFNSNQPLQIGECGAEPPLESSKKRAFVRGVGKPKAKKRQKLLLCKAGKSFSSESEGTSESDTASNTSDSEKEKPTNQHPIFKDSYVDQSHPETVFCQGVLWLSR